MQSIDDRLRAKLTFAYSERKKIIQWLDENDERLFPKNAIPKLHELAFLDGRIKVLHELINKYDPF